VETRCWHAIVVVLSKGSAFLNSERGLPSKHLSLAIKTNHSRMILIFTLEFYTLTPLDRPFPTKFHFPLSHKFACKFFLQLALGGTWLWLSFHCLRQSSKRKQKFFDFKETLRKRAAELGERLTGADAAVWRIKIDWQFVSADCKQRDTEERPQQA